MEFETKFITKSRQSTSPQKKQKIIETSQFPYKKRPIQQRKVTPITKPKPKTAPETATAAAISVFLQDIPNPPKRLDCDEIFAQIGVTGYSNNDKAWDNEQFYSNAGELLGTWSYFDEDGDPVEYRNDPRAVQAFLIEDDDPLLFRAKVESRKGGKSILSDNPNDPNYYVTVRENLASCLKRGPSQQFKDNEVEIYNQNYDNRSKQEQEQRKFLEQFQIAIATSVGIDEQIDEGRYPYASTYPILFWKEEALGDGLCFYRSIGIVLFYNLTGHFLGPGLPLPLGKGPEIREPPIPRVRGSRRRRYPSPRRERFDYAIVPSDLGNYWETEDYEYIYDSVKKVYLANGPGGLSTNAMARWVKFYAYVVNCTNVPVQNVNYFTGITGLKDVIPLVKLEDMFDLDIVDKIRGKWKSNPGVYYVPSMDLITRYVAWVRLAFNNTLTQEKYRTYWTPHLKSYYLPLWAAPFNIGPFSVPDQYPEWKTLRQYEIGAGWTAQDTPLWAVIQDSPAYGDALKYELEGKPEDDATFKHARNLAYRNYCYSILEYVSWGGQSEAVGFSNLFYGTNLPFQTVVIWGEVNDNNYQYDGLIKPVISTPPILDTNITQQLCILWSGVHYDPLLPQKGIPILTDGQLVEFIYGFPITKSGLAGAGLPKPRIAWQEIEERERQKQTQTTSRRRRPKSQLLTYYQ